jgi:hypothetical protein
MAADLVRQGHQSQRLDGWAFLCLDHEGPAPAGPAGQHWLKVRRNQRTGELAFYRCCTLARCRWLPWSGSPGRRWAIEERLQTSKGLVGLDQHQVRRGRSWYRWATLAVLAHALPVVAAMTERAQHSPPLGLIRLQRDPGPVCGPGHLARRRCRPPVALVAVATPTLGTRPRLPLPTTGRLATMKITIYGWRM